MTMRDYTDEELRERPDPPEFPSKPGWRYVEGEILCGWKFDGLPGTVSWQQHLAIERLADARVREALEKAAKVAEATECSAQYHTNCGDPWDCASSSAGDAIADSIRAMMPGGEQ